MGKNPKENINDNFIPAKKSLGQNFLISTHALDTMIEAGEVTKTDTVIEVGPGKGALTERLLKKAGKVIAIEKDDRLIPFLEEQFADNIKAGEFELVHGDALEFEPEKHGLKSGKYKILANIPYYITGSFFQKFFEEKNQPSTMVVLVQKEVAERIARDKKESILSLSIKAYGTPKYIHTVSRNLFRPVPNVDSAILAVHNISKNFFTDFTEEQFFKVIKIAFAHKRKKLAGNLRELFDKETIEHIFSEIGLDPDIRSEQVDLDTWQKLLTCSQSSSNL
jgi:16S rRNA (adenine1518-N6/adenine1519-N6)-dimethyltransferase